MDLMGILKNNYQQSSLQIIIHNNNLSKSAFSFQRYCLSHWTNEIYIEIGQKLLSHKGNEVL